MTFVYLYDDRVARRFEPFSLTRPAGEMRAGALLVRERWSHSLGVSVRGHFTAPHLAGFEEMNAAPVLVDVELPVGSWIANARFAPVLEAAPSSAVLTHEGRVVAVRLETSIASACFADGSLSLESIAPSSGRSEGDGWWLNEVWDYVRHLVPMLESDLPRLGASMRDDVPHSCHKVGSHPVYIEHGATVEPFVAFDTEAGPVLIRAQAHVASFTRLVGPLYIGPGSIVTTDRVAASSIGDTCKVHGELSNSIVIGHSNKGHDGFVGHSILGRWVNLGAGTITSNLKNTYGSVQLWTPDGVRDSGMQFLGTLFGDHSKTGIGLTLTTGSILGAGANVYGSVMPPKAVPPFAWGEAGAFRDYRPDKFLEVAARMMARRHVTLRDGGRAQLLASYDARWRTVL